MKRITWITDDFSDITLWYVNDVYVGHDDQFDIALEGNPDLIVKVELEKIQPEEGWLLDAVEEMDYEVILAAARTHLAR